MTPLIWLRPPSAVLVMLIALLVFRSATEKLRMRDFRLSLIPIPAESSDAWLIRKPLLKR